MPAATRAATKGLECLGHAVAVSPTGVSNSRAASGSDVGSQLLRSLARRHRIEQIPELLDAASPPRAFDEPTTPRTTTPTDMAAGAGDA
jgi:hypothetical protein